MSAKAGFAWWEAGHSAVKTRCPNCQTIFRVTPQQVGVRAGKVRCGQCQKVFNALESLIEKSGNVPPVPESAPKSESEPTETITASVLPEQQDSEPIRIDKIDDNSVPLSAREAGMMAPRETSEIPGYSKWTEGVMSAPLAPENEKSAKWPFVLFALALLVGLLAQATYHFRSEIVIALPSSRPMLDAMVDSLGTTIPLPQHAELVSIETSDLQADTGHSGTFLLQATLRNRAVYAQAYPFIELSLTDTQDIAIARRIFSPQEYLPVRDQSFAANSDTALRLRIEARNISAAGYRLYVFYP